MTVREFDNGLLQGRYFDIIMNLSINISLRKN